MPLASFELEFPALWPAALAVALLTLVFAWRALRRRTRPLLVLLRSLTLLLIATCLLGPIYRRPTAPGEESALAIVVDASASMSVTDTQRSTADELRLATTLGLITLPSDLEQSNTAAEALLAATADDVATLVRAREAAEYVDLTRQDPTAARSRLATAQAALATRLTQVRDSTLPPDARTALAGLAERPDDAAAALATARIALRESQDAALRLLAAASPEATEAVRKVAGMSRFDLALALAGPRSKSLANLVPPGTPVRTYALASDLLPLTRDTRPAGTTTDFNELARLTAATVSAPQKTLIANLLPRGDIPLRAILLLTDGRSTSVPTADSSFGGIPIFAVNVAPAAAPRTVTIESIDLPTTLVVGQSARIHVRLMSIGADGVASARLLAAGQTQYRSLPIAAGESTSVDFDLVADRAGEFSLTIAIDPPPGSSPGVAIQARRTITVLPAKRNITCVFSPTPGFDAQLLLGTLQKNPTLQLVFPDDDSLAASIRSADAIILEDTDPEQLSPAARSALAERTVEQGAGLLLLPGPKFLPERWAEDKQLARFVGSNTAWHTSFLPDGEHASPQLPAGYWRSLDAGALSLRPSYVGAAPVLLASTDQLWRSRLSGEFPDLLTSLLEPPYAETNGREALAAKVIGRTLAIRARRLDGSGSPVQAPAPTLILQSEDRGVRSIATTAISPGRYVATISDLPDGEYSLRFLDTTDPRLTVTVGQSAELELQNPAGDPAMLASLAAATGGVASAVEDISILGPRLSQTLIAAVTTRTTRLWSAPATLVILLALLSAEWALRKHWGLA